MTTRCYLCQERIATTVDHVPPKSLFPDPKPANLLTLPACQPCNEHFAKDEEYFRNNLSVAWVQSYPITLAPIFEKFRRAYKQRPSKLRELSKRFIKEVDIVTPTGIYLGKTMTYKFSIERTLRVILKIAKGLRYHHLGPAGQESCEPTMRFYSDSFAPNMPKPEPQIYELLKYAQIRGEWGEAFQYAGYYEKELGSAWWMRIHKGHLGMVIFGFCDGKASDSSE